MASGYSSNQMTLALYPVVVRLIDKLVDKNLLTKAELTALLDSAAKEVGYESHLTDRPEAIELIHQIRDGRRH